MIKLLKTIFDDEKACKIIKKQFPIIKGQEQIVLVYVPFWFFKYEITLRGLLGPPKTFFLWGNVNAVSCKGFPCVLHKNEILSSEKRENLILKDSIFTKEQCLEESAKAILFYLLKRKFMFKHPEICHVDTELIYCPYWEIKGLHDANKQLKWLNGYTGLFETF